MRLCSIGNVMFDQGQFVAFQSFASSRQRGHTGNGADSCVSILDQVADQVVGGAKVVYQDRVNSQTGQAPVDGDNGYTGFDQPLAGWAVFRGRCDDDACNLFCLHQIDVEFFFVDVLIGVAQENCILMMVRHILHARTSPVKNGFWMSEIMSPKTCERWRRRLRATRLG